MDEGTKIGIILLAVSIAVIGIGYHYIKNNIPK